MSKFRKPGNWWTPASGVLTEAQAAALADVISEWAILEIAMQKILCVLAQAPLPLGQALTEDLGPDNRIKALKRLAATWRERLGTDATERQSLALNDCVDLALWVSKAKARRNQLAHWTWLRSNDEELFGFKYSTRPVETYADPNNPPPTDMAETVTGLVEFAERINEASKRLHDAEGALLTLPTWPRRHFSISALPERPETEGRSEPLPPRRP